MSDDAVIAACYYPVEAAIIRRALQLTPAPGDAELDLWGRTSVIGPGVIRLEPSDERYVSEARSISDAAARLVLSGLERRLPNYMATMPNVALLATRGARRGRRQAVQTLPIFLFGINWADSSPGMSWPEQFHLGWLPGFDLWVVTGSRDSTEMDGYCGRVMGAFTALADALAQACGVIQDDWLRQRGHESQER